MERTVYLNSRERVVQAKVGHKPATLRRAVAYGEVHAKPQVIEALLLKKLSKGDALTAAKIGAILAAKKTAEWIPLCHPLNLEWVDLSFQIFSDKVEVKAVAEACAKTGVEMEALTAVSSACLILYDMCKSLDPSIAIGPIYLLEKEGGKSGHYTRTVVYVD